MTKLEIKLPDEYLNLSDNRREILKDWIDDNFHRIKIINNNRTSYGLKHILERDTGVYYSNDEFKGGMLELGYIPHDVNALNWRFNISEKSINDTIKRINNKNE